MEVLRFTPLLLIVSGCFLDFDDLESAKSTETSATTDAADVSASSGGVGGEGGGRMTSTTGSPDSSASQSGSTSSGNGICLEGVETCVEPPNGYQLYVDHPGAGACSAGEVAARYVPPGGANPGMCSCVDPVQGQCLPVDVEVGDACGDETYSLTAGICEPLDSAASHARACGQFPNAAKCEPGPSVPFNAGDQGQLLCRPHDNEGCNGNPLGLCAPSDATVCFFTSDVCSGGFTPQPAGELVTCTGCLQHYPCDEVGLYGAPDCTSPVRSVTAMERPDCKCIDALANFGSVKVLPGCQAVPPSFDNMQTLCCKAATQ